MENKININGSKFQNFLAKAGAVIKEDGGALASAAVMAATGNIPGALAKVAGVVKDNKDLDDEFARQRVEIEAELYELEVRDRESARMREVEIARTGKMDIMFIVTGAVGLSLLIAVVMFGLFGDIEGRGDIFHLLMGEIMGIGVTIFAYYYGTSRGGKE